MLVTFVACKHHNSVKRNKFVGIHYAVLKLFGNFVDFVFLHLELELHYFMRSAKHRLARCMPAILLLSVCDVYVLW